MDRRFLLPGLFLGLIVARLGTTIGVYLARGWSLSALHGMSLLLWSLGVALISGAVYLALESRLKPALLWVPVLCAFVATALSVAIGWPRSHGSMDFGAFANMVAGTAPVGAVGGLLGVWFAQLWSRRANPSA